MKAWLDVVPQLLVWTAVAVHEAVGVNVCSREDPDKPHPLQDQLPPVAGSGLSVTSVPEPAVTAALWVRVPPTAVYAVIGVALHVSAGGGMEEDPPPQPDSAMSAAVTARWSIRNVGKSMCIWRICSSDRRLSSTDAGEVLIPVSSWKHPCITEYHASRSGRNAGIRPRYARFACFRIHESNAILRYLCAKHGLDAWYPQELQQRAKVEQWLDWNQCRLSPTVVDIVLNSVFLGSAGDQAAIARGRSRLPELWSILEAGLRDTPFLVGARPSIADLSLASSVFQLTFANIAPTGPETASWFQRVSALEGFRKSLPMQ
ncbi:MAG TPA: glutathione S-transferase family protein [Steroidobacteraceae bacterium]|nr:glutathione S-transferase family protein [Steroidobacteraceae bacterium]